MYREVSFLYNVDHKPLLEWPFIKRCVFSSYTTHTFKHNHAHSPFPHGGVWVRGAFHGRCSRPRDSFPWEWGTSLWTPLWQSLWFVLVRKKHCHLSLENLTFAAFDILSHFPDGSLEPSCSWASLSKLPHCYSCSEPMVVSFFLLSAPNHFSVFQWVTEFYSPPCGYWISLIASCGGVLLKAFLFGFDRL